MQPLTLISWAFEKHLSRFLPTHSLTSKGALQLKNSPLCLVLAYICLMAYPVLFWRDPAANYPDTGEFSAGASLVQLQLRQQNPLTSHIGHTQIVSSFKAGCTHLQTKVPSWWNYFFQECHRQNFWEYEPAKAQHPLTGSFASVQQHKSVSMALMGASCWVCSLFRKHEISFLCCYTSSCLQGSHTAENYTLEINAG